MTALTVTILATGEKYHDSPAPLVNCNLFLTNLALYLSTSPLALCFILYTNLYLIVFLPGGKGSTTYVLF